MMFAFIDTLWSKASELTLINRFYVKQRLFFHRVWLISVISLYEWRDCQCLPAGLLKEECVMKTAHLNIQQESELERSLYEDPTRPQLNTVQNASSVREIKTD